MVIAAASVPASPPPERPSCRRCRAALARGRSAPSACTLQDFAAEETLRAMPCSHAFHCRCISKWLCRSAACHLCRHRLPATPEPEEDEDDGDEEVESDTPEPEEDEDYGDDEVESATPEPEEDDDGDDGMKWWTAPSEAIELAGLPTIEEERRSEESGCCNTKRR
ncbi:hypothetical protein GQ55_1G041600 [Panicum hallii var. hallii]|uniref:RING-type E3 ubiquitin transferase n=1 Tax=Panicum hallii var. hallii TaxID=1504633 RepID=A0A2T7F247_9POAL|nr:hypothetical protein GQ55_1G041600 [Panicum hallii var. hallii]